LRSAPVPAETSTKDGLLYIVATPIGNLEDITLRAIRILREVGLIAAEDTRRTRKLLNAHGIDTPLTSLYDQNEARKSGFLVRKMKEGLDVAYVSDAGTPGISDPGYLLVRQALENGIRVVPVPGPSAVVAALSISGLPMDAFVFNGFLPAKTNKRRQFLKDLNGETRTMVFYESPNRLAAALADIRDILADPEVVVVREMTKVFEEVIRDKAGEVIAALAGRTIKGEITLIVAGRRETAQPAVDGDDLARRIASLLKETDLSRRDITDRIAAETGLPRQMVYREVIRADRFR
jgi:16S rRNA (cytidine1402-2'-O)-methyltransferase